MLLSLFMRVSDEKRRSKETESLNVKKKKTAVKCIVFVFIFIFLLDKAGEILAYKYDSYYPNNGYCSDILYDLPENSLDVVYIGTSQFHMGVSPLDIWDEYQITGCTFTAPNCRAWLAYYELVEVLKYQTPTVVVLDAAVPRGDQDNVIGIRRVLGEMRFSFNKLQALYDCLGLKGKSIDEMINTASEFFAYHDRWDQLEERDFTGDYKALGYQKGYLFATFTYPYSQMNHEENNQVSVWEMSDRTLSYMDKIKKLCEKNGIELMLAKTPSDLWNSYYSDMVDRWAKENDVPFLDMTLEKEQEKMGFDGETGYFDPGHLNHIGAESASSYLGKYLTEHYSFSEKSEAVTAQWEEDSRQFAQYKAEQLMRTTEDLNQFLELIRNPRYLICIAAKDDAANGLTQKNKQGLKNLGLKASLSNRFRSSYLAVVDAEETVTEQTGKETLTYQYLSEPDCEVSIISSGYLSENRASILINGKEYAVNSRGLNFVIYDKEKKEVICSRVFDTYNVQ